MTDAEFYGVFGEGGDDFDVFVIPLSETMQRTINRGELISSDMVGVNVPIITPKKKFHIQGAPPKSAHKMRYYLVARDALRCEFKSSRQMSINAIKAMHVLIAIDLCEELGTNLAACQDLKYMIYAEQENTTKKEEWF